MHWIHEELKPKENTVTKTPYVEWEGEIEIKANPAQLELELGLIFDNKSV